jgi:hypothetical protein
MIEIDNLDHPDFTDLFTTFTSSAWRLETLPVYNVPYEQAAFDRFLAGKGDSSSVDDWIDTVIAPAAADGRDIGRVHVIERTTGDDGKLALGDYLRFELFLYRFTKAAGEDIRIAWAEPGSWPRDVSRPGSDFWLFDEDTDDPTLVKMRYHDDGSFDSAQITDKRTLIAGAVKCKRAAQRASRPFYP